MLTWYGFVIPLGQVRNAEVTPFIVPARVPMMILRDPPGG